VEEVQMAVYAVEANRLVDRPRRRFVAAKLSPR
jgi:hypothetical protein